MMSAMKSTMLVAVGLFATMGVSGMAQDSSAGKAMLSTQDKMFIKAAEQSNIAEIKTSQLALKKATKSDLKDYGQHMIDAHTKARAELKELAASKGATLPADTNEPNKAAYSKLTKLNGAAFDSTYTKVQRDGHEATVAAFKAEIADGKDPDVKAFATKNLPEIQSHLDMIKNIKMDAKAAKMSNGKM